MCDVGRMDSLNGKAVRKAYFRKSEATWSRSSVPQEQEKVTLSLPDIVLDEGMNRPPGVFAIDPSTGRKSLLTDLNPQFQGLALARVEEVAWKTSFHACREPNEKCRCTDAVSERTSEGPTSCCRPVSGSSLASSCELLTRASASRNSVPLTDLVATTW